jgi:protein-disulfide isomerase
VALTYVHLPLPMHRFAVPAARAAECAGNEGRFEAMYDTLYARQDEFGITSWSELAATAGVKDSTAFDECLRKDVSPRVVAGRQLATSLGISGTPTVIIQGWQLGRPPDLAELEKMVRAVMNGRSPV